MNTNFLIELKKKVPFIDFNRLKLQWKFFVYFAGIVVLVTIFISVAVFYFQKQMLFEQAREKAFSLTRSLAYLSLNAYLEDDYIGLQSTIDSKMGSSDIISIAILDTAGFIKAADEPELRGRQHSDPLTKKALSSPTFLLQQITGDTGEEVWDTAVPIYNLNERIGTARIKYSVDDTYQGLFSTVIIIGILALIISLPLSYRFSRQISSPIQDVVNLAGEFGKGNLDAKIQINRSDEIGQLVASLNKLSQELKTLIDERIANESLIMIGEFASFIIHDLKNPLSGLHLLTDGLHRKIKEGDPLKRYSTEILIATKKLQEFVGKTLDIARPGIKELKHLKINELIDTAINGIQFNSVQIIKQYAGDIPEMQGDEQVLSMAIKNLLTNASEAIPEKGAITIETKWTDKINIIISDTGIGIPKDKIGSIFRPFFSMKNTGHGLGLAMVKKAVIMHQGNIKVDSEKGVGSTFHIMLPKSISA